MNKLTQKRLKELLKYNKSTGMFIWINPTSNRVSKGKICNCIMNNGYIVIRIDKVNYLAHRLAYLYVLGYFPEHDVDHKNGIKNDNRWKNLRHVSRVCNSQNAKLINTNKSGFIGVYKHSKNNSWIAHIRIGDKKIHIGSFKSPELAAVARVEFENNHPNWNCNYRSHNINKLRSLGYDI